MTEKFGPNVVEAGSLLANKFGEEAKAKRHEAAIALEEAEKAKAENNNETNRTLVKQARDNFETASRRMPKNGKRVEVNVLSLIRH